jgi:SSS family solute:Na+ symporter
MTASLTLTLAQAAPASPTPLYIIIGYLALLLVLGTISARMFRGTSSDYFVASRSIGPFMLLMSVFGTTMTAFALVGSTAKSFDLGIGVYGLMASWSGLIHAAVFFLIGIKLWAIGKRYGYITQIQYFRDRFESRALGYMLFPVLVLLVMPYLLVGLLGAGSFIRGVTRGMYPEMFSETGGAVPPWLTALVICAVVLYYVFYGGVRSAAWANTFQTIVFMVMGLVAFYMIARALGGPAEASRAVIEHSPEHAAREGMISRTQFLTYCFIPLSVGMFPHLFQHWLTVIAHPICIMIVWLPCILIGIWAAAKVASGELPSPASSNAVLGLMVNRFVPSDLLTGLLSAGVLAAIMSSLDSQFVCIGSMFTNDIVIPLTGKDRFTDRQKLWLGRGFVIAVVVVTYLISLGNPAHVFDLGVWCFTGFASLFPLVFAAVYWKRATRAGAIACVVTTAIAWALFFADAMIFTEKGYLGSKDPGTEEYLVGGAMAVAFIFAASATSLVVVSLLTRPLSRQTIDKFFAIEKAPLEAGQ